MHPIVNNKTLSDKQAVKAFASRLENPVTLEILAESRQSQTEHFLKVLSVVLIAVGIGIIPTLILSAKRLYDSGGSSINFFKPLSKNLCEDAVDITSNIQQAL